MPAPVSLLALATAAATVSGAAMAQDLPCTATVNPPRVAVCMASAPPLGATFSGPVLQVIDGELLCVAAGPTPDAWIPVRPSGLPQAKGPPAEARSLLMAATFSKRLDCVAGPRKAGAVAAACTVEGADLSDQMRAVHRRPGWRSWR